MMPSSANAKVLPIAGWPAIGNSVPGVKMRIRTPVPAVSAGRMNVDSEKFISLVMVCIWSAERPRRVVEHGELVAFELTLGEDVVVQVAHDDDSSREARSVGS